MQLRAVLLDVDGTLLDTNHLHAEAWRDALTKHGHQVPLERVQRLIGMGSDKLLPELTGLDEDAPGAESLLDDRKRIFLERCLPRARAFARTRDLLQRMLDRGLKLVVASSASRTELDALLAQGELADLLVETTSSDDAERSKPDPDIVQAALRKANEPTHATVMLGDTPYDVEAASRAGVRLIALRCGGWDDQSLAGAVEIYDDPADLLSRYEASLLGHARA